MSLRLMGQVWQSSSQEGGALLVLLALADFAHDDGSGAWPSIHTLALKSRLKDRQVQRVLKQLEAAGEIAITRGAGPGGANLYQVYPPGVTVTPGVKKTPGVTVTPGVIQYTGGVSSSTPKPLVEPLTSTSNPPVAPPTAAAKKKPRAETPRTGDQLLALFSEAERERLAQDYPSLHIAREAQKCVDWWTASGKVMDKPRLALQNWLDKGVRIQAEAEARSPAPPRDLVRPATNGHGPPKGGGGWFGYATEAEYRQSLIDGERRREQEQDEIDRLFGDGRYKRGADAGNSARPGAVAGKPPRPP